MAVIIESSYGKTIGLPGYSSHKFCLSLKTEVADLTQVVAEAERVYAILQSAVDIQMSKPGFVPNGNGQSQTANSHTNGNSQPQTSNGAHAPASPVMPWCCSPKQRLLIEDLAQRSNVEVAVFGDLARKRFGKELAQLNKLEASGLLGELLEVYGDRPAPDRRRYQRQPAGAGGRGRQ